MRRFPLSRLMVTQPISGHGWRGLWKLEGLEEVLEPPPLEAFALASAVEPLVTKARRSEQEDSLPAILRIPRTGALHAGSFACAGQRRWPAEPRLGGLGGQGQMLDYEESGAVLARQVAPPQGHQV